MNAKVAAILNYDKQLDADLRSLTGAFYTPLSVARDMAGWAAHYYLINCGYAKEAVCAFRAGTAEQALANDMLKRLQAAQFIDMACGTGAFGMAWLLEIAAWQRRYRQPNRAKHFSLTMANMLLNDVNDQSVAQFKQLVRQYFEVDFGGQLLSCDALLELPEVAKVKDICAAGGFDIVIGNPPYIGERGNTKLFKRLKGDANWSQYYLGKMDYSYFFIHQALNFVSPLGVISQLISSYFMTADGAKKLRADIRARASWLSIRYFQKMPVDWEVNQLSFTIMTIAQRREPQPNCAVWRDQHQFSVPPRQLYSRSGTIQLIPPKIGARLAKLEASRQRLADVLNVNQGLVSGADRLTARHSKILGKNFSATAPIFVFEAAECEPDDKLKPFVKNSDIGRYQLAKQVTRKILYSAKDNLRGNQKWLAHLAPYRALLERRREVKNGIRAWYELQWPRQESIFLGPKIIAPQRAEYNCFAYVAEPLYGSADVYFLTLKSTKTPFGLAADVVLKALTVYLNGAAVEQWLAYKGKRKGYQFELYATPLKQIPLPHFSAGQLNQLATYYDHFITTADRAVLDSADQLIEQLF